MPYITTILTLLLLALGFHGIITALSIEKRARFVTAMALALLISGTGFIALITLVDYRSEIQEELSRQTRERGMESLQEDGSSEAREK